MASAPSRSMRAPLTFAAVFCLLIGGHAPAEVRPNSEVDGLAAKFVDVKGVRTRHYDYGEGEAMLRGIHAQTDVEVEDDTEALKEDGSGECLLP